jgi:GGDEF domain-containing protein
MGWRRARLTLSVGVAQGTPKTRNFDALLIAAEQALRRAKRAGPQPRRGDDLRRSGRAARQVKLALRQLEAHLKKGLAPLYTVHGPEALLALEAADRIREAARARGR